MRYLTVGLGNQGRKRIRSIGDSGAVSVDPFSADATFSNIEDVALSSFDAAFICTPESEKFGLVKYLVARGKHVIVEKPLLLSELQFDELEAVQESSGATIYVAYNHRFEPHIVALKGLLEERRLGEVYHASIVYGNGTASDVARSAWRDSGLGVASDLGSHVLDLVDYLWGLAGRNVKFVASEAYENNALDFACFGLTGKPNVSAEVTLLSWKNEFQCVIRGSSGTARLSGLCKWGRSRLTIETRKIPSGPPDEVTYELLQEDSSWSRELEAFEDRVSAHDLGNLDSSRLIALLLEEFPRQ